MLPSKRAKQTLYITKPHQKVGGQIIHQYDAEDEEPIIKYQPDSEDEREQDILASTNDTYYAELNMTCSSSEDSLGASNDDNSVAQLSFTNQHPELPKRTDMTPAKSAIPSKEPSIAKVLDILTTVSTLVKDVHSKSESIQEEMASISNRLARVERKVGISLATMEQVKDVVITGDSSMVRDARKSAMSAFDFEAISNYDELMQFNSKLGNDETYYCNAKMWVQMQINNVEDPDNRMHKAMDLIFERTFLPQCSWSGNGKPAPKIPLGVCTNILKLFADIGSNQYITVNELFVQKFFLKKLPHAKNRINLIGDRASICHKRKSTKE